MDSSDADRAASADRTAGADPGGSAGPGGDETVGPHIPGQRTAGPAGSADHPDVPAGGSGAPATGKERRRGRLRRVALVAGLFLTVTCLVGAIFGYVAYDRATRIDRSSPVVVVEQYVDTVFSERDPARAELFECGDGDPRADLQALLDDLMERERRFNIQITVSTANYRTTTGRVSSQVDVDLIIDVPEMDGRPSRSRQGWEFDLRDESGWRVCAARRAG